MVEVQLPRGNSTSATSDTLICIPSKHETCSAKHLIHRKSAAQAVIQLSTTCAANFLVGIQINLLRSQASCLDWRHGKHIRSGRRGRSPVAARQLHFDHARNGSLTWSKSSCRAATTLQPRIAPHMPPTLGLEGDACITYTAHSAQHALYALYVCTKWFAH